LWWKFIRTKYLIANSIILDAPKFVLRRIRISPKDTATAVRIDLLEMLSKEVKNMKIGSVLLNDATVTYEFADRIKKRRALLHLEKLDLFIDNLHIDFVKPGDNNRKIFADNYLMKLENYRFRTADSLYWLAWKGIEYNSVNDKATIESFSVEPRYEEKQYWQKVKTRRERHELTLKEIVMQGIKANELINEGTLRGRSVTISDGKWEIFQNMSLPLPAVKKNICFSQKLMAVKFPFYIDTVNVSGINIHFKQYEPKSGEVGHLTFDNIHGKFLNVTNSENDIRSNPHLDIALSAKFMDACRLSAQFHFRLDSPEGMFELKAELEKIDAAKLNRASVPLARLEIANGTINKLVYQARGNESFATGNIAFLYDDLKMNFLEPNEEDGNLERQGLKSFLAGIFVIKQQNPGKGKEPRKAINVTTTRHPRKGYFNMVWRTLFAGLKEIILVK
jgi:hypothetical protein